MSSREKKGEVQVSPFVDEVRSVVQSRVVGKSEVIDIMLATLISRGHVLLEGPPGTGKTLLAKSFASAVGGVFKRIQLTPDLLPADIIGTSVYDSSKKEFVAKKGPIFANVVMADELNRASPRTQSAFLEAMQERQVTIDVQTYKLPEPFMVIATQVPEDTGGIYPLTRTQIDRFAVRIEVNLPTPDEERAIIKRIDELDRGFEDGVPKTAIDLIKLFAEAEQIHVSDAVIKYIVDIVAGARSVSELDSYPSPRASIWLFKLSRAIALLNGRNFVLPDDVKMVAPSVLSHRLAASPIQSRFGTDSAGEVAERIKKILAGTPVPKE